MSSEAAQQRRVSVIVLAWGDEPLLRECVQSALDSEGVDVQVVLVDNGATKEHVEAAADLPGVHLVRPRQNLGYAGGCNFGAREASGDTLLFLNSDAKLDPSAALLLASALGPEVGLAMASVRLWNSPEMINSAGNPWHYTGFVWAGGLNDDAAAHNQDRDVICASGATMAITRELWTDLGGFDDEYFAYHEDAELSLRLWQRGLRVRYVAGARSYHHYEFSRNANKQYLLERNRLMSLFTLYERRTLLVLAPMLLGVELGILAVAGKQGWFRQKLAGYGWLWRNRSHWLARRRTVQRARTHSDRDLAPMFSASMDAAVLGDTPGIGVANVVLKAYWSAARHVLARR